jgi:phosphoglycerol geranylgeranyltransferase
MDRPYNLLRILSDGKKKFAPLIDPDKYPLDDLRKIAKLAGKASVDFILYGGSLVRKDNHEECIAVLKENCRVPVIAFPGNPLMIPAAADGLLLLSLISGRNADLLIGRHVEAASFLKDQKFEILPTGYMLIGNGHTTAVAYMSNTIPIPSGQDDIAACTAVAGELLGLKVIYLEGGSGASVPVSTSMIAKVRASVTVPLIVGGGIRSAQQAVDASHAGADLVVVGNAIEQNPDLLPEMASSIHRLN